MPKYNSEEETESTEMIIFECILSGNDTTEDADSTAHPIDTCSNAINNVYLTNKSWNGTEGDPFHSVCVDSAPQRSITGVEQAKAY